MKIKTTFKRLAALLAFIGLAGVSQVFAESESNDTTGTANTINIGTSGNLVTETGSVSNPDVDYFKITNSAYSTIEIQLDFSGSGSSPDTLRLKVLAANGTTELFNSLTRTGIDPYKVEYTINSPASGAVYYICVEEGSADGTKNYDINIDPSPNIDLNQAIAAKEAEILAKETRIQNLIKAKIAKTRAINKLKKKIKRAKGSKKRKLKKKKSKLGKLNRNLSRYKVACIIALNNLENELNNLIAQLP